MKVPQTQRLPSIAIPPYTPLVNHSVLRLTNLGIFIHEKAGR